DGGRPRPIRLARDAPSGVHPCQRPGTGRSGRRPGQPHGCRRRRRLRDRARPPGHGLRADDRRATPGPRPRRHDGGQHGPLPLGGLTRTNTSPSPRDRSVRARSFRGKPDLERFQEGTAMPGYQAWDWLRPLALATYRAASAWLRRARRLVAPLAAVATPTLTRTSIGPTSVITGSSATAARTRSATVTASTIALSGRRATSSS